MFFPRGDILFAEANWRSSVHPGPRRVRVEAIRLKHNRNCVAIVSKLFDIPNF